MTDADPQAIRLGLIVDSDSALPPLAFLLASARKEHPIRLSALIVRRRGNRNSLAWKACEVASGAIFAGERAVLLAIGAVAPAFARRAGSWMPPSGAISSCFEQVVDLLPGHPIAGLPQLDLLVTLDHSPLGVELTSVVKEIIQMEAGSAPAKVLQLTGFAEAFSATGETPVRLYRIGPQGRERAPLIDGFNRTRPLFYLNQIAIWDRALSLLLCHLAQQRAGIAGPAPAAMPMHPAVAARSAGFYAAALAAYPFRLLGRLARFGVRYMRGRGDWSIAIHRASASASGPVPEESHPVEPAPPGTYHADPILYRCQRTGRSFCFVEEFDKARGRAHIAVLEQGPQGWIRRGPVLTERHHLSFPFLFEYQDTLYMCPECAGLQKIVVYRCVEFPMKWEPCAPLMTEISAADTMLFKRDDRWWMLTCVDRATNPDHQSELHLFYADSPLSTHWRPVLRNPVRVTPNGGRNGGLVNWQGRLFRFGQIQSFDAYGQGLMMHEVVSVGTDGYEERYVQRILPPARWESAGVHTYSCAGDLVAFDLLGATDRFDRMVAGCARASRRSLLERQTGDR